VVLLLFQADAVFQVGVCGPGREKAEMPMKRPQITQITRIEE
jgi:hypothetical protein